MPVPGPDGSGVATARQAAADPAILEAPVAARSPVSGEGGRHRRLSVLVAADPWSLSRRYGPPRQASCAGEARRCRLAVAAESLGGAGGLPRCRPPAARTPCGLWDFPWETPAPARATLGRANPPCGGAGAAVGRRRGRGPGRRAVGQADAGRLFAARLREFRGDLDGPDGAKAAYLARPPLARRRSSRRVQAVPPGAGRRREAALRADEGRRDLLARRAHARRGGDTRPPSTTSARMTLEAAPDSRWADAARANLGLALAALGRIDEAVRVLRGGRLAATVRQPPAGRPPGKAAMTGRPRDAPRLFGRIAERARGSLDVTGAAKSRTGPRCPTPPRSLDPRS